MEIDVDENEANIEGTPDVMKSVHQMLSKEDNKVNIMFLTKQQYRHTVLFQCLNKTKVQINSYCKENNVARYNPKPPLKKR